MVWHQKFVVKIAIWTHKGLGSKINEENSIVNIFTDSDFIYSVYY